MREGLHLRALVIEDDPGWQSIITELLLDIEGMQVERAKDPEEAWKVLSGNVYELITIDLSLIGGPLQEANQLGFEMLDRLRRERGGAQAALVIVTGYPTPKRVRDAYAQYDIDDFIQKGFEDDEFDKRIRGALLKARVRAAAETQARQNRLAIWVSSDRLVAAELGPRNSAARVLERPLRFDASQYSERADKLNVMLLQREVGAWRRAARALGQSLYKRVVSSTEIADLLIRARQIAQGGEPLLIQFNGPSSTLRIPFELLLDGNDYLCFEHVITRRIAAAGVAPAQQAEPFHELVRNLAARRESLRVLLVAANSDGRIPGVNDEVGALARVLETGLQPLGIHVVPEVLKGSDATRRNVRDRVINGRAHVLHYAGHGRFDDTLPEVSGIILGDKENAEPLSATELKQIVEQSHLHLVYLSCCVGARTAQQVGRGDFHGTIDAIARGDVPTTIGYRWVVPDDDARCFAISFYQELFRTLAPGLALLYTRRDVSVSSAAGRNNSMWASPILVSQTGT